MAKKRHFHSPFRDLKLPGPAKPGPARAPRALPTQVDDSDLFAQAMEGVRPLCDRPPVEVPTVPLPPIVDDDAESLAVLADLVSGEAPLDLSDAGEFVEGAARDLDRRILRGLKRGDYAVKGHLDLHGMDRTEAKGAVEAFIADSRKAGKRCVLIIHGRGLNSKDQIPVLKEALITWLTQGRIARQILAFSTARPHDGGAGAMYVLLRR